MIQCEQFVYGLFKGYGIKLVKSPGLNGLLPGEIIEYLCQLSKPKEYSNLWPNGVITVTKVYDAKDEYGRNGIWSHTIAMRLIDYLAYMQPTKVLASHFLKNLEKPPKQLNIIKIEG